MENYSREMQIITLLRVDNAAIYRQSRNIRLNLVDNPGDICPG